jgi:hypothetical protein
MRKLFGSLFGKGGAAAADAPPAGPLTAGGLLASDLWIDRPDAGGEIDRRLAAGEVTEAEAARLRDFAERGYLILDLEIAESVYDDVERTVETLWRERPADVAFAYHSPLKPLRWADPKRDRKPSYRIADLQSRSAGAAELMLHPEIHRAVGLVFGRRPIATQTLYFEFGSQQELHRDPVHVQMDPPSHLAAAWIALEDIDPASGPLVYVAGSHRLPYYQFEPGEHRFDQRRFGEAEVRAAAEFDRRQIAEAGLAVEAFTPRRGQVLVWHHSLLHGGSPPADPALTRKSLVVHFSTADRFTRQRHSLLERVPGPGGEPVERLRIVETEEVVERDGCLGFVEPLKYYRPRG